MPKIDITKTELVWPGKYNDDGTLKEATRVNLPFQVIETVNESRATREAKKSGIQRGLFDVWEGKEGDTFEDGWRNKLVWGDNLVVMGSLLEKFAGKIDLVYIDPPFATGSDFSFTTEIGESGEEISKEQSTIEEKTYRDTWGRGYDSYLQMMYDRLLLIRELLSEHGSLYVHCDWRVNYLLRSILDELFGAKAFQNEIVWGYKTQGATKRRYSRKHDTIFFHSKTENFTFNYQTERSYMQHTYGFDKEDFKVDEEGRQYRDAIVRDFWEIPAIQSASYENLRFETQKPEALLKRIIKSSSNEGGLVADVFCGLRWTPSLGQDRGNVKVGFRYPQWVWC